MKKNIIKLAIAGAIAIVGTVGYNFSVNQNDANFQFAMDNIEALAEEETGSNYVICYSESRVRKGYTYYDCGTCKKIYDERGKGAYSKCFK